MARLVQERGQESEEGAIFFLQSQDSKCVKFHLQIYALAELVQFCHGVLTNTKYVKSRARRTNLRSQIFSSANDTTPVYKIL